MMMKFIKTSTIVFLVMALFTGIGLTTFNAAGGYLVSQNYVEKTSNAVGDVLHADGGFIVIEFETDILVEQGDTEIIGFIVDENGRSYQMKPILIPAGKYKKSDQEGNVLVFPIKDIAELLQLKVYAIEMYVKNSKYSEDYIELPLITLDFTKFLKIEEKKDDVLL